MTPRQKLDALLKLLTADIRSAFMAAIQDIVDSVLIVQVTEAIERGDFEAAFRALGFSQAALRPLIAAVERAYERGGVFTGETFPQYLNTPSGRAVFRFDVRNSRAEAWLRDKSSTLITRIETETMNNVRNVLRNGMEAGRNPRNVALDIVGRIDPTTKQRVGGIVGLTEQQEQWVRSTRSKLVNLDATYFNLELRDKRFDRTVEKAIRDGKPLPADTIERLITRYKANALKYRGEMIGRTEALQSLNASEYEAVKQAVDLGATTASAVRREWDSAGDSRVRWSHSKMDGQRVGLDQAFTSPSGARMMHPGDTSLGAPASEVVACRCRAKTVIDWLADID